MSNGINFRETVANSMKFEQGANEEDIALWNKTYTDLSQYCDITAGITDEYTKDLIVCWSGWVLLASSDTVNRIYDSLRGFNIAFREDERGGEGDRKMTESVEKRASDPMSVWRDLAKSRLARIRKAEAIGTYCDEQITGGKITVPVPGIAGMVLAGYLADKKYTQQSQRAPKKNLRRVIPAKSKKRGAAAYRKETAGRRVRASLKS